MVMAHASLVGRRVTPRASSRVCIASGRDNGRGWREVAGACVTRPPPPTELLVAVAHFLGLTLRGVQRVFDGPVAGYHLGQRGGHLVTQGGELGDVDELNAH